MVHQVYKGVNIPIMGLGGIMTGTDAIEFMMVGAQAVQVGVAAISERLAQWGGEGRALNSAEPETIENLIADINFCFAVKPRLRFLTAFTKSSKKPSKQ